MPLTVYKSPDGRYRSETYNTDGERAFAIAEKTAHGVLVSEFNQSGELLDQIYKKSDNALREIGDHLKSVTEKVVVVDTAAYEHVLVNAACDNCNSTIKRQFDLIGTKTLIDVPVVQLFNCVKCKKKFYSMNSKYISRLVSRNPELFEDEELKLKHKDEAAFVKEIQEYMIRIFASKRLTLMKIKK